MLSLLLLLLLLLLRLPLLQIFRLLPLVRQLHSHFNFQGKRHRSISTNKAGNPTGESGLATNRK